MAPARRLSLLALMPLVLAGLAASLAAPRPVSAATTTGDGSWVWLNPRPQGNPIGDISCPNALSCFATARGILHTADAGKTWVSQPTGTAQVRSVSCPSSLRCVAVGG